MTEHATTQAGASAALPRPSDRPLSQVYDVALLDLDGVVYLGRTAVPGAPEALAEARNRGMRLAFVTNNASRSSSAISGQLTGLGVPATPAEVISSAHAAARLIAERLPAGSPVLVVGGIGLRIALRERGLRPVSTAAERPAAVVQGYAPDIGYPLLAEAGLAVRAGAWYVAANVDATMPTARGIQPGNGSLVQVIVTATGRQPVVAGKPEPPLHSEAVARTGAKRPLVVGDRLDTDIEGAVRVGADSLLVLTGVTRPADAVLAPRHQRPTYLAHDVSRLLEPHPAVTRVPEAGGSFRCGGWTVRRVPAAAAAAGGVGHEDRPGTAAGPGSDGRPGPGVLPVPDGWPGPGSPSGPDGRPGLAGDAGSDGRSGPAGGPGPDGRPGLAGDYGPDDGPGLGVPGSGGRPGAGAAPDPGGPPDRLEITGSGAAIDGLRALCAAAWASGPVTADSVQAAVSSLPFFA
jgi:HAD superfamily hydrolase (TIGR01450 family)